MRRLLPLRVHLDANECRCGHRRGVRYWLPLLPSLLRRVRRLHLLLYHRLYDEAVPCRHLLFILPSNQHPLTKDAHHSTVPISHTLLSHRYNAFLFAVVAGYYCPSDATLAVHYCYCYYCHYHWHCCYDVHPQTYLNHPSTRPMAMEATVPFCGVVS